ncbi:MAG TPA: type II toxin-antitoxin system VapC family toxin [Vicinamibacterales bacterium]|nr:type II toxin-antitoxin system VapC family toxin [Vicinamibacterales bacterium]
MAPALTAAYFDSALVAKFYVNEPGRSAVRRLARRSGVVVTSRIAVAEVSAAFHRKHREGSISPETFRALNGQFAHDVKQGLWKLIAPTESLLDDVQALFAALERSVFLRSPDAVHLVTARSERFDRLYTNDRHLLEACPAAGLEGVDPTS